MGKRSPSHNRHLPRGLSILHEDRDILVVDKPIGLLTVSTRVEKERTAHAFLEKYIRKGDPKSRKKLYVVHRLDRDTSGVLIFAKTGEAMLTIKDHWKENKKTYVAVVHGRCEKPADTISSYLTENAAYVVRSTTNTEIGKLSHTAYTVIKQTKYYSLLEIDLLTGRKNQIRVHLSDIGHPVVGDPKYGDLTRKYKRMALHALSISFRHPYNGKPLFFTTPIPPFFTELVGPVNSFDSD